MYIANIYIYIENSLLILRFHIFLGKALTSSHVDRFVTVDIAFLISNKSLGIYFYLFSSLFPSYSLYPYQNMRWTIFVSCFLQFPRRTLTTMETNLFPLGIHDSAFALVVAYMYIYCCRLLTFHSLSTVLGHNIINYYGHSIRRLQIQTLNFNG